MNVDGIALPFVDEHSTAIAVPRDLVWPVLRRWAGSIGFGERNPLAALWAAEPRTGFEISREIENQQITLTGRHRFSRYALVFDLTDLPDDSTRLTARSYAEFPGAHGRAYRALVIGTRLHVVATTYMLRSVRRRCPSATQK